MVVINNSPKEEKIEFERFKEVMYGFAFANAIFEGENLDLKSVKTLSIPSKSVRIYEMRK
jgi:hypothetical protein